jgi:quercetin dioxygenase-like cupin family protein
MSAIIVKPDAGESYWLVQERITPLVTSRMTRGAFEIMQVEAQPNGGPPPHVHRHEDELFYVVEGTFDFAFEDHVVRAGAGEAFFLPRDILHTYNNVGDQVGRLIVAAAPANFVRFLAEAGQPCRDRHDRDDLPQVGPATFEKLATACAARGIELRPTWKPTAAAPAATTRPREVWIVGLHIRMLLTSPQTRGQFSVAVITTAPGEFVPLHLHRTEEEVFYVLEGTVEFDPECRKISAGPGTLIHVPKQTFHGFGNVSDRPAKLLNYHTPGGFENFFLAAGTECTDVKLGPPKVEPDLDEFARIALKHGMELAPGVMA